MIRGGEATSGGDGLFAFEERDAGGVPLLWANAPGQTRGALLFRVGRADERLVTAGLTHLVEHLALFPLGRTAYAYNGFVGDTVCAFVASGTADEVFGFLTDIAASLSALEMDRLESERRVLLTEWLGHQPGVTERLLDHRYGAQGFGLSNYFEWGLHSLGENEILSWAARHFTAGNAVAWCTAEPPIDFRLALPPGDSVPAPVPAARGDLLLPLALEDGTGGVTLGTVLPRSTAAHAGFAIAADRTLDRLRREAGLSYQAGGGYEPLDASLAHVVVGADCRDPDIRQVRDGLLAVLHELAEAGPNEQELEHDRAMLRKILVDQEAAPSGLDSAARNRLLGTEAVTSQGLMAEREALTPSAVANAVADGLTDAILLFPPGAAKSVEMAAFREVSDMNDHPVEGRTHQATREWAEWGESSSLVIGDEGITFVRAQGPSTTVRFVDAVALIPGLGGTLSLVGRNGHGVSFAPGTYRDGDEVANAVRKAVPDELKVPLPLRERGLVDLCNSELGPVERAAVPRELDILASVISADDTPMHLAVAARGNQMGLLVVTESRLAFLFRGTAADDLFETELNDLTDVQLKGLLSKRLTVTTAERTETFTGMTPAGRDKEIYATLVARSNET